MSTKNRRPLVSSTSSSSLVKKKYPSSEDSDKITAAKQQLGKPQMAKKRPALVPISNQRNAPQNGPRTSVAAKPMAPCVAKITKLKNVSSTSTRRIDVSRTTLPAPMTAKSNAVISHKNTTLSKSDRPKAPVVALPDLSSLVTALPTISSMDVSPRKIDDGSVSLDETMSTCDSLRSPEFEYIDNVDASAVSFIKRKPEIAGNIFRRVPVELETNEEVVDIDNNVNDPQFCATIACDIYKHLRACEIKKMPSPDYMERIQISINASMRGILIDWLVEVSEEYNLLPETLYLTVNYIDRYLSRYVIKRERLQLLGVVCMMIAAKYEEICPPKVDEFHYVTDNTYYKHEILLMESEVLNSLKFEMSAPTTKIFLSRYIRAAQGENKVPSIQLECLSNYIAELSTVEYNMLCYAPSLIAASATFMAKFMLCPHERPWNSTLVHYTLYDSSDLYDCVKALHRLCYNSYCSTLPAIREKYSQHKYKNVAKMYCPSSIPLDFFEDLRD